MTTRLIRSLLLIALISVLGAATVSAQTYWFENYQNAVDKIDSAKDQDVEEALVLLDTLVADHPIPQSRMRIPGDRYLDYLPYLQRARVHSSLGHYDEARRSLRVSEAFGAVKKNRRAMVEFREVQSFLSGRMAANP